MTYKESVVRGTVHSEHFVQLFDSQESLASSVASYLAPAVESGDNILVVAKPKNWEAIAIELKALGCDVNRGVQNGRITVLDAGTSLHSLSRGDMPDVVKFDEVVGSLVRSLTAGRRLTIYGEMVELLAEEGNFDGVLRLEGLWNSLSENVSFRLMCGYSSAHFACGHGEAELQNVCKAHSAVRTRSEDPLGAWLVERTRLPIKPDLLTAN